MATGISSRSFIAVIKRSGVVSEEELDRALAELRERTDVSMDDTQSVAKALIDQGVVTRWQAEKLLQGKHKGFFLGPYRLLDMLGRGGMGAVYLAEHTLMRRRCAIKVLPTRNIGSRSYLERFYREAQAVAAMDHKNIVRAYDVNQAKVGDGDVHFLAMEFVEGRDLQRTIDEDGVLPYSQAAEYVRQAAEGLAHAHEANMVHRDIKPANLLVNNKGVVKILDLGLAKFYDDGAEAASLTVAHNETVLGTADYLAPEQAVDSHNTDHRADIYSLGCTFYFLLTGHPPFCEGSVANRLLHHQMKAPPSIRLDRPDAPDSLLVIIDRMMAKNREERYQSAKDVADDLAVWLVENGNEEWRERNPELVRKVGESWRADTKVVAGSLVDTAELHLAPDDDEDLGLAPLEGAGTPTESPLIASGSSVVGADSSSVVGADSHLDLAPHEEPDASKPDSSVHGSGTEKSGIAASTSSSPAASGVRSAETTPASADAAAAIAASELPSLDAHELAPLEDLHLLDSLASTDLSADTTGGLTSTSAPSGLNAPLGLPKAAPIAAAAQQKKAEEGWAIPMPVVIGVAGVAVLVVLTVLVLMITSSGKEDETVIVTSPASTLSESRPLDRNALSPAAEQAPVEPTPESNPPGSEAAQTTATPPSPMPEAVDPNPATAAAPAPVAPPPAGTGEPAASQAPGSTTAPEVPAPAPEVPMPAAETPAPAPAAAPTVSVPPPQPPSPSPQETPAERPPVSEKAPPKPAPVEATPATANGEKPTPTPGPQLTPEELWGSFDTVSLDLEIPAPLSSQTPGLRNAVLEVLGSELPVSDSSSAKLHVNYQVEPPKERGGKYAISVDVRLTTVTAQAQNVEIWSASAPNPPRSVNSVKVIGELREEAAKLVRRMTNERKRALGKL